MGCRQSGSMGCPQPVSLDDSQFVSLGRLQSVSLERSQTVSPGRPQSGSLGRPQPVSLERPQPGSLGCYQYKATIQQQIPGQAMVTKAVTSSAQSGQPHSIDIGQTNPNTKITQPSEVQRQRERRTVLEAQCQVVAEQKQTAGSDLSDEQVKRNAAVLRQMSLHNGPGSCKRYTQRDLVILYTKASNNSQGFRRFCYLYRDKTTAYFNDIRIARRNIMGTYVKDLNGDPRSPINGKLHGLFFNTLTDFTTDLPKEPSIFGDTRLRVPVRNLVTMETNMYFADFYCNHSQHYVTLVVTTRGSRADEFCKKKLLHVPLSTDSPFFRYNHGNEWAYTSKSPIVEVFYTQSVDVGLELSRDASLQKVNMIGSRSGGYIGLPKNSDCRVCNM